MVNYIEKVERSDVQLPLFVFEEQIVKGSLFLQCEAN